VLILEISRNSKQGL